MSFSIYFSPFSPFSRFSQGANHTRLVCSRVQWRTNHSILGRRLSRHRQRRSKPALYPTPVPFVKNIRQQMFRRRHSILNIYLYLYLYIYLHLIYSNQPNSNLTASLIAITLPTKVGLVAVECVNIQSKLRRWCTIARESELGCVCNLYRMLG